MNIEQFVAQSLGEWKAMRSSHSLAFQQFEEAGTDLGQLLNRKKNIATIKSFDGDLMKAMGLIVTHLHLHTAV